MAIKRPASAVSGDAQAKKKMRRNMRSGSHTVAQALKKADLPADTKKMLTQAVKLSLTTFVDERHEYQSNIVKMVADSLGHVESQLNSTVIAAKEKVASIDALTLQMAIQQQAQARAAAKTEYANKEADVVEAKMKYSSAEELYKVAMKEQKASDLEYTETAAQMENYAALVGRIDAMKIEANSKRAVAKLLAQLKAFDVDASLISILHNLFEKAAEDRGEFEARGLLNLESELAEKSKSIEAKLVLLEPAKVAREEAIAGALHAYESYKEQLDAAKAALKESVVAVGSSEKTLQAAGGAFKNLDKHTKQAQDEHVAAEKALADFQQGPKSIFQELAHMKKPLGAPAPEQAEPEPIAVAEV